MKRQETRGAGRSRGSWLPDVAPLTSVTDNLFHLSAHMKQQMVVIGFIKKS